MKSTDIIRALNRDGWTLTRVTGSHHHFHHPRKAGIVTVQHPRKDVPLPTPRSIESNPALN
jgi:predicted RNA binding protein YcfA (HicA-like mRNA interferase family)